MESMHPLFVDEFSVIYWSVPLSNDHEHVVASGHSAAPPLLRLAEGGGRPTAGGEHRAVKARKLTKCCYERSYGEFL